jgi:hypothetical protein
MHRYLIIFFFSAAFFAGGPVHAQRKGEGQRAWLLRPAYSRFNEQHWVEIGIGRMNSIYSLPEAGLRKFRMASAGFTLGAEAMFAGRQTIIAPKMAVEVCATVVGARVSYAYFMQNEKRNGVIGIEGGFCIFSVCYAYVGYNFVKGNRDTAIVPEGVKLSVGFNFHLWPRDIPPPKQLGER